MENWKKFQDVYPSRWVLAFLGGCEEFRNFDGFVEGTLIKWHLPLDQAVKIVGEEVEPETIDEI